MQEEIKAKFILGLRNRQVRRLMITHAATTPFDTVGNTARQYAHAMEELQQTIQVDTIRSTIKQNTRRREKVENNITHEKPRNGRRTGHNNDHIKTEITVGMTNCMKSEPDIKKPSER